MKGLTKTRIDNPMSLLENSSASQADLLMEHNFDVGCLRPFKEFGRSWITLNEGTDDEKTICVNTPSTLTKDQYKIMDQGIIDVHRKPLVMWKDLQQAGATYNIPNGLAYSMLQYQTNTDITGAKISMEPLDEDERDRLDFDLRQMPLPIIHKGFSFGIRQLMQSKVGVNPMPLDVAMPKLASRKISEYVDDMCTGVAPVFTYGGESIYGIGNHPDRILYSMTPPTSDTWRPSVLINEVLAALQLGRDAALYGPWRCYMSAAWHQFLEKDYSEAKGDNSVRSRLMEVGGISSWVPVERMEGFRMIFVQMDDQYTIRAVTAMPLTLVQWDGKGGMAKHWRLMCMMYPQIKTDANGITGIIDCNAA